MFIAELFHGGPKNKPEHTQSELINEANQAQLVVLYPGRFQPFHLGHADVFRTLQAKFGRDNVFIATSNKTDSNKSPFNFTDKTVLMHAAGVPSDRILEVTNPYRLPAQFDPANTVLVVAVGAPDADRLQVDGVKKDGNPGYYKTFKSFAECETADKHGYVIIAAERHKVITLNGQQVDVSHGTPSRAAWNSVRKDPKGRAEYMTQMFGRADQELGRVLDKIPANVGESLEEGIGSDLAQLGGIAALGVGLGIGAGNMDKHPVTTIQGDEYIQHELPQDKSNIKITKDDKGNKVYAWVEQTGMKPRYTYHWFAPVAAPKKESVAEGIFDRFKRKPVTPDDPQMMQMFRAAGGYDRNIDVMGWQIGWKTCAADPSADPKHIFRKMYYGGGSPVPFDQKSFMMGFNACAKNRGVKRYGEVGNSEVTPSSLAYKDFKRDRGLGEGAPIVVMPMRREPQREPQQYGDGILSSFKRGVQDAKAGKPYSNPFPFDKSLGAPGNYDHNSYREGYQSISKTEESMAPKPTLIPKRDPEQFDDLVKRVCIKAKQGPMTTIWVPAKYGTGGRYRVVPVSSLPVKEQESAPMTRTDYQERRKALQQIQMDPKLTKDPVLRKEVIKKIAQLTAQARAAGVLPESAYYADACENRVNEAKCIVNTINYLKESVKGQKQK
jgi:cytidyltransferase-like protein